MTEYEKYIYNVFLRVTRTSKGLPFKYRKDFSGFEDGDVYPHLKKLCIFFKSHPYIDVDIFLKSPFNIRESCEERYYALNYFTSPKAIKDYTTYCKHIDLLPPDAPEQIALTKRSIKFIIEFCKENKISIGEYINFTTESSYVPSCIIHLKNRSVNIYTLLLFNIEDVFFKFQDKDYLEFTLGERYNKSDWFRMQLYTSQNFTKLKKIVETLLKSDVNSIK